MEWFGAMQICGGMRGEGVVWFGVGSVRSGVWCGCRDVDVG